MKHLTNMSIIATILLISLQSCEEGNQPKQKEYINSLEEKNTRLQQEVKGDMEYIKNLEEKKAALQQELEAEKYNQYVAAGQNTKTAGSNRSDNSEDYFTIGSTEKEVIRVMGDPTSIEKTFEFKTYYYYVGIEFSTVGFENGRVAEYRNTAKNLKVKMRK